MKGASVVLGGTLLSVGVATWMQRQAVVDPAYTQALMANGWLIATVVSLRYTTLKGWPGRTQAVFIGGMSALVASLAIGAAWLNSEHGDKSRRRSHLRWREPLCRESARIT